MLQRLVIRNYALIDNLDITFSKSLNIITGETGAGKSIILGALSLILGQRAESRFFFNQQKKCVIEGIFAVNTFHLEDFFREHDLDYDSETVLRREISADGKSRAFINDTPVKLGTLKNLGEKLIDIHSQHATLEINDEDFQLLVVDTVAGNLDMMRSYHQTLKNYRRVSNQLKELINERDKSRADLDYYQFQFDELDKAGLSPGEQSALEQEQDSLTHAEEIKRSLLAALSLLNEEELSVLNQIREAQIQLGNAAKFAPAVSALSERLRSMIIELKDIIAETEQIEQSSLMDEERLTEVGDRLTLLYSLQQKHRAVSSEDLIEVRDQLSMKLQKILFADEDIENIEREHEMIRDSLREIADRLTASRNQRIAQIEADVQKTLQEVGMPNAKLAINLETFRDEFFADGQDKVQFLFSANKGQGLMPMNKVASGGELSRLMLSIKSLIAVHTSLPTIIFDEIDTGISGETALRVGSIMEKLAESMQVIAITHLPQIASKGKSHYRVFKDESLQVTQTNIRRLDEDERIHELAVMLSGNNPVESALQNARDLLR